MAKVYSVGQINTYIRNMFAQDFVLGRVSVRGEISNCKYHTSGHIYFSLKDAAGTIACVMFASARKGLAFRLSEGQQVVVSGSISVYERDGKYQLYASRIQLDGAGVLYEKFLALKLELEEMGMFAPEYKKPIPAYAKKIGVITAPTGAAVRDIINIATRRNPGIMLYLFPAKVQGEGAAQSVAYGLQALDALGLDVLIVGRGGGSIEDLWAFNEEIVARAIFSCKTPVISAVGHETDTTIADFVADLRAPTPSAAAELAVADMTQIVQVLGEYQARFSHAMSYRIHDNKMRMEQYQLRLKHSSPMQRVRDQRQHAISLEDTLRLKMEEKLNDRKHKMAVYIEKMKGLSPLEKLAQGYAAVSSTSEGRISSVTQVNEGDILQIYVSDGRLEARTIGKEAL